MVFIDQGEFEATKMLSGGRASSCDEHQFRAKMMVSTRTVFEISLLSISGLNILLFRHSVFRLLRVYIGFVNNNRPPARMQIE